MVDDGGGDLEATVTYELQTAPTTYYRFAATSNMLDSNVSNVVTEVDTTLREHWRRFAPRGLEDVDQLPAPAKLGVAVVVVTDDGVMAVARRARQWQVGSAIAGEAPPGQQASGRAAVHFVAEGMTPADRSRANGRPDPMATAVRGMWEEFNIPPNDEAAARDLQVGLTDVGAFCDHQR